MSRKENEQYVKHTYFEKAEGRFTHLITQFADNVPSVLEEAAINFDHMLPDMAYINKKNHPMAASVFSSSATLAVYLAIKKRGIDVHDFGCAMLTYLEQSAFKPDDIGNDPKKLAEMIASGEASLKYTDPGEYVFETFPGDQKEFDWGVTIKRCALCYVFSKYDAEELTPYMCAMNDVMSDMAGQGLRRTGTIALGDEKCEYRYKNGGEPLRLAPQFPEQIHYNGNS